ncbi:MAG: M14 family metallocarboxypeptidase [Cephaloticoccus sp.]|nr:M14 family metallocarboxypeptidase [Cephaloticoccus sp.]
MTANNVPFDVTGFLTDFHTATGAAGGRSESFGKIDDYLLPAWTRRTPGPRPRVYLSAGVHGDEPAPPLALLDLLRSGFFDHRANWFICPMINPFGLQRGIRENGEARDLNRDYQDCLSGEVQAHVAWLQRQPPFDLTLCLHEDWESQGFYLYELNPSQRPTLAPAMIKAVAGLMPIESAEVIDGRPIAEPGIIRPVSDPSLRTNWPEAIYLRQAHTTLSYTLETPSALLLETRIAAQKAAITAAITTLIHG